MKRLFSLLFLLPLTAYAQLLAGDDSARPNSAPIWGAVPTLVCEEGDTAGALSLPLYVSDPDGDTLTFSLNAGSTALPTGVTLVGTVLDCGLTTVAGMTTGVIIDADDGTAPLVPSPSITIDITASGEPSPDITVCASGCTYDTVQPALDAAVSGQVVEIQADPQGSTEYFNEELTLDTTNGDPFNEIVVRGRQGDTIVLYTDDPNGDILTLSNDSYWTFQRLQFGRTSEPSPPTGTALNGWIYGAGANEGRFAVEHRRWLQSVDDPSSYITFIDTVSYGGRAFDGGMVDVDASHFAFIRHDFRYAGINNGGGSPDRDGNTLTFRGSNSIFIEVTGKFGGHDNLSVESPYVVVRKSIFDGDWTLYESNNPGRGNRAFTNEGTVGSSPYGPNLIEKNVIRNADFDRSGDSQPCGKFLGYRNIVRQNYLFDCLTGPAYNQSGGVAAGVAATNQWRIYNNTEDNNDMTLESTDNRLGSVADDDYREFVYKNNISANLGDGDSDAGEHIRVMRNNSSPAVGDPDDWRLSIIENNILHVTSGGFKTRLAGTGGSNNETTVALAEAEWPNVLSNNITTAPTYLAQGDRDSDVYQTAIDAFAPAVGSAQLGTAAAHTQADGSGSSESIITVDDPFYFVVLEDSNYFDMQYFVDKGYVPSGDCIKIGTNSPVRLTSVNYTTRRMAFDTDLTWADNDDVFLVDAEDCTTVIDNIGAYQ